MSERIEVVLDADASQLEAEFKKARATLGDFGQKIVPAVNVALERSKVQTRELSEGFKKLQQSSKGSAQGMLQVAQFADDAQYGIRGVLNNIPGLVMGLGGGAGLAGALSLVVLAGAKIGPMLKDAFGGEVDEKAIADITAKVNALREKSLELARVRGELSASRFVQALGAEEVAIQRQNQVLALNSTLLEARRRATASVDTAAADVGISLINANPQLSPDEKARQRGIVQADLEAKRAKAEMDAIKDQVASARKAAAEGYAAVERAQSRSKAIQDQIDSDEAERQRLQTKVTGAAMAEGSIPGAEAALQAAKDFESAIYADNAQPTLKQANEATAERVRLEEQLETLRRAAQAAGEGERRNLAAIEAGLTVQRKALEDQLAVQKEAVMW